MDENRLAEIAAQLVGRVRGDGPEANARWLAAMLPDPADWWALCFVLAAAVPDDRRWSELVGWVTHGDVAPVDARRKQWRDSKRRQRRSIVADGCAADDATTAAVTPLVQDLAS